MALKARSNGLLNKNAHSPPLSKTSNSPSAFIVPNVIHPLQWANEGIITPFTIRRRRLEGVTHPKRPLTLENTFKSITPTMAPSSNRPHTRTISPLGPLNRTWCKKGFSGIEPSLPTEYRLTVSITLCVNWLHRDSVGD